jgi:hypothetical protein
MLELNAVDNVCHEHLENYLLLTLEKLLAKYGLEVFDVKVTDINGGSFRTYVHQTRGGTTVEFLGLDSSRVVAAVDKNLAKWGRKMIGSIPIVSPNESRWNPPDFLLVLPWHLLSEIKAPGKAFFDSGGKLVTVMPTLKVVSK